MSTQVMSEIILSTISLLQSVDDKTKSTFDTLPAKIVGAHNDMAGIRADITDIRRDIQSMSKKLDDILRIVKWS